MNPSFEFCQYNVIHRPQDYWMTHKAEKKKAVIIPHDDCWCKIWPRHSATLAYKSSQGKKDVHRQRNIQFWVTSILYWKKKEKKKKLNIPLGGRKALRFTCELSPMFHCVCACVCVCVCVCVCYNLHCLRLKRVWFLCSHSDKSTGSSHLSSSNNCPHYASERLTTPRC